MIVEPKTRGFICTTAHPAGCRAEVKRQIDYVKSHDKINGPKKVLVIGASTGYGLASRIALAFGGHADTIGVIFDKPASKNRTASAGWYNSAAFEEFAQKEGLYAKTVNGDAFSLAVKKQVIDLIKKDFGKIDMLVYSLAAPRRHMEDGTVYSSVLKTTKDEYTNKTVDLKDNTIGEATIEPATDEEVEATIKVMGGEDWKEWIRMLKEVDAICDDATTLAYSYIGPELTHAIYKDGSIGMAKNHLYRTAEEITKEFAPMKGYVSINKALVTQSSAAIPIVPLYISILYRIMKDKNVHEGCIEQMYRLFHDKCCVEHPVLDENNFFRLDDLEQTDDIQSTVSHIWDIIDNQNKDQYLDMDGYWEDFFHMFGFHIPGVDYAQDVNIDVPIPSIPHEA